MENDEQFCPLCGSELVTKVIDYSDWNDGRLLVVRAVPVRECAANGHRFFAAKVARSLEKLFQAREVLVKAIPEEPIYGHTPLAGLPKGFRAAA